MSLVVNLIGQRSRDVIGRLSVSRDVSKPFGRCFGPGVKLQGTVGQSL